MRVWVVDGLDARMGRRGAARLRGWPSLQVTASTDTSIAPPEQRKTYLDVQRDGHNAVRRGSRLGRRRRSSITGNGHHRVASAAGVLSGVQQRLGLVVVPVHFLMSVCVGGGRECDTWCLRGGPCGSTPVSAHACVVDLGEARWASTTSDWTTHKPQSLLGTTPHKKHRQCTCTYTSS